MADPGLPAARRRCEGEPPVLGGAARVATAALAGRGQAVLPGRPGPAELTAAEEGALADSAFAPLGLCAVGSLWQRCPGQQPAVDVQDLFSTLALQDPLLLAACSPRPGGSRWC